MTVNAKIKQLQDEHYIKLAEERGKTISHAGSGVIILHELNGKKVVVKTFYFPMTNASATEQANIKKEIAQIKNLRSPYLVSYFGRTAKKSNLQLVMPYYSNHSLVDLLYGKTKQTLTIAKLLDIAYGIANGLEYLHGNKLLHEDLRTSNVLLDENFSPALADYACIQIKALSSREGRPVKLSETVIYAAPELLLSSLQPNEKTDIFALGTILFELFTGQKPWRKKTTEEIFSAFENKERACIPKSCPEQVKELIISCWAEEPNDRPAAASIARQISAFKASLSADKSRASACQRITEYSYSRLAITLQKTRSVGHKICTFFSKKRHEYFSLNASDAQAPEKTNKVNRIL